MQQHVRITTYELTRGTFRELVDVAREGLARTLQEQPGFLRSGFVDLGAGTFASLSLWETRPHGAAAMPAGEAWMRDHLGDRCDLRSTQSGELAFFDFFDGMAATT